MAPHSGRRCRCPPAGRHRGGRPRPPTPQRRDGDAAVAAAIAVMGTPVDAAVRAMAAPAAGRGGLGAAHPSEGRAAPAPDHPGGRHAAGGGGCVAPTAAAAAYPTEADERGVRQMAPARRHHRGHDSRRRRRGRQRRRHGRGHGRRPLRRAGARRARGRPPPTAASAAAAATTPPAAIAAARTHRARTAVQIPGKRADTRYFWEQRPK